MAREIRSEFRKNEGTRTLAATTPSEPITIKIMKKIRSIYSISLMICFFSILPFTLLGQEQRVITGKIIDADTDSSLPFSAIGLKNNLKGTTSNENGEFKFTFPSGITDDSLIINYLGYEHTIYHLKDITSPLLVKLPKKIMSLDEFIVLPHPPEYYIKLAVRDIPSNYSASPYESTSYYREKSSENGKDTKLNECVFKSYTKDTSNQHQLLLFKKTENELNANEKGREKEKKKEEEEEMFNLSDFFGGPKGILNAANINNLPPFMDSLNFKNYNYIYERNTTYNGREVMEIKFSSKKRKHKMKLEGVLYIDKKTNAFISVYFHGDMRLPIMLKPVLLIMGVGIKKPYIAIKKQYQEKNNLWYINSCQIDMKINVTQKHMFKKNEETTINVNQLYNINNIKLINPMAIEKSKQFDSTNKDYQSQVHNDIQLKWNQINRVEYTKDL